MEEGTQSRQAFLDDLKAAREYQGVSLEQVAGETHISLGFLRALEEGRWDEIPLPFLRGYLTAYAECVGMVREKVLKRFDELGWQPAAAPAPREEPASVLPRVPFPGRRAEPVAEPVVPLPVREPAPRVPTIWEVVPSSLKGTAFGVVLGLLALIGVGATLLLGGPEADPAGDSLVEPADLDAPALQGFTPFRLEARLRRSGELDLRTAEAVLFHGTLPADSALRLSSPLELSLTVPRLEDLRLWRDGRPLDLPADNGPAELRLTREAVHVIRRTP